VIAVEPVVWIVCIVAALAWWAGAAFARRQDRSDLTDKVWSALNTDTRFPLNVEQATRELRTLLAIDGHRLPKHVRDAANVWLAERESS
jgi:hypothetical protein